MNVHRHYSVYAGTLLLILVILNLSPVKQILAMPSFIFPAIWTGIFLSISYLLPRIYVPGRLCLRQHICGYAFSGAIIFLSIRYLIGAFLGKLSATPYDISPVGILYNLISLVPALAARESIREYALGTAFRVRRAPVFKALIITLLFALLEINFSTALVLKNTADTVTYIARDVVPVILKSMVLSILVYYGGARAGAVYSLAVAVFQRIFPFLPSLPWLADSALGISFPVLFSFFLIEKYHSLTGEMAKKEEGNAAAYAAGLMCAVLFSWFVVGVFPIYPSVVLTGSMEPDIRPGDAILVRKLTEEKEIYQLQSGDIINFKREDITITHRILGVIKDEAGNVSFQTKGDNNQSPDTEIVAPNDINGMVIKVIPKVGIPVLIMKSSEPVPEGVVEELQ